MIVERARSYKRPLVCSRQPRPVGSIRQTAVAVEARDDIATGIVVGDQSAFDLSYQTGIQSDHLEAIVHASDQQVASTGRIWVESGPPYTSAQSDCP